MTDAITPRVVPEDRPLSDEDREFLYRRGRYWQIDAIDRAFPPGSNGAVPEGTPADDEVDVDSDIDEFVKDLPVGVVKAKLIELNVAYDAEDTREDLNTLLVIALQDRRNSGEEVSLEA